MKIRILISLMMFSVILPVCANEYVVRVKNKEIAKAFERGTILVTYSDWSNSGSERNCTQWLPLESTYDLTQFFTQSQECTQDIIRNKITTTTYASGREEVEIEVESDEIAVSHNKSVMGSKRKLVVLPSGIAGVNFTRMTLANGTEMSSEKINRMKYMVANRKESLWGYSFSKTYILTEEKGSSISIPHTFNLPTTTGISMPYSFSGKAWSFSGDTDRARLLITNYGSGGQSSRLYDTGYHNYSSSWSSISNKGSLDAWANKVIWTGLCVRSKGKLCSAKIRYGTMRLNYDLPAKNTSVYLYK